MKSLVAEQIKVARILLNLGHSYLHSTSLENSEDEEEEGEEEEEEECRKEKKEEKSQQFDGLKQIFKEFKEIQIESPVNIENNIEEEMEIEFDGETEQDNKKIPFNFDTYLQNELYKNAHIEDIYREKYKLDREVVNKFDKEISPKFKTNTQKELNKHVLPKVRREDKSNINVHFEFGKEDHEVEEERIPPISNKTQTFFSKLYGSDVETQPFKKTYIKLNGQSKDIKEDVIQKFDKFFLQDMNGKKVLKEFDREKQKQLEENNDESGMGIQIGSEFQHGLSVKVQEELREKHFSQKEIEIELGIETQVNPEFQQELDGKIQEEFYREKQQISNRDIEIELNIEMQVDPEFQQELDKTVHEEIDRQKEQNYKRDRKIKEFCEKLNLEVEILKKYDRKKQLNIDWDVQNELDKVNGLQKGEKQTQKESNKSLELQQLFNDKMDVVAEFQQDLIRKKYDYEECDEIKQKIYKEINLTCNGKLLNEFNIEKQLVDDFFDQKIQFNSNIQQELQEKLQEFEDEYPIIDAGIQQELRKKIYQQCNGELLQQFNKNKQNVKQKFVQELQCDSNVQHKLKEKIRKQQNMHDNDVHNLFDKNMKHIPNRVEKINNLQTEFDEKNIHFFKIETQEIKDVQNKINRKPKQIKEDIRPKYNEHSQVQFDNELQEIDEEKQMNKEVILKLELELESQKKMYEKIMDTFHREIQQRIKRLVYDFLYGEQKINKEIQYNLNGESYVEKIKQIQQEIEELQNEIKEFNQNEDEELERNITNNIDIIYSLSVQINFLENLLIFLCQDSTPFYERIEKLCDLYFPTMCKLRKRCNNEIQTDYERGMQQTFNKELLQKLDMILQQEINGNLHNNYDTEAYLDNNEITYQKLNEEMQKVKKVQQLLNNHKQQYEVNENTLKADEKNIQLEFQDGLKKVEGEIQINFGEEISEEIIRNKQKYCERIAKKKVTQNFDIVIQYNNEIKQKLDGKTQQLVQGKVQINVNEEIMKKLKNETLQNFDNNEDKQLEFSDDIKTIIKNKIQQNIKKGNWKMEDHVNIQATKDVKLKFHNGIQKVESEIQETSQKNAHKMQQKVDENMEVDFNDKLQMEVKKWPQQHSDNEQMQDRMNEKIYLQLEFFNKMQVVGGFQKKFETEVQEDFEIDIETFKRELLKKSEDVQEYSVEIYDFEEELLQKSNAHIDEFKKEIQVGSDRESDVDIEEFDGDTRVKIQETCEVNIEEASEIDVEEFNDKLPEDFEEVIQNNLKVCVEKSKIKIQDKFTEVFQQKFDKPSFQEIDEELLLENEIPLQEFEDEINKLNEINEVVEVVEEFEVESTSSVDSFISTDDEFNPIEEISFIEDSSSREDYSAPTENGLSSAEEEFSFADDKCSSSEEDLNEVVQQNHDTEEQVKYNENVQEFEEELQEFEDLQFETGIENIKEMNEIPLELKIQQEQFEEELHEQFNEFQKEFYTNLKLEYNKKQEFIVNKTFNPVLSQVFDEQQQKFYELNDDFHEIKQEYKSFVQQKMFEELQREMDEKLLLEHFPETFDSELNVVDEDIHKEFLELQRDCNILEPEFKSNVPLELEENNLSQLLKQEPFNLFKKLHCIHKQKLCDFVDSKHWPENCLYPSSLLDDLYENPFEVKPNVLVITLYSIDIGYSIKISINKNETPIETFFNYAEDSILKYVEKEQLPPHLLDILDKAEPRLFYCGCIIAEIHDHKNGIPGKVCRILLRPFNMSIQSDFNQILAENNHVNWTYRKRLQLESILILVSHPIMCMDSSPIAGFTVHLQHQILACRSIQLNPLKNKYTPPKLKSFDLLDSCSSTPRFSNKQKVCSKMMDTASDNIIIWKFDFCIKSFKLLKLFVLVKLETQECSMLMCMNSKVESFMNMRFKINLETNKLKDYIHVILQILKEKICPDILVFRRYKIDDKSTPHSIICVPTLFNDNIYEPVHADISVLINKLLESKSTSQCDTTKYKSENISQVIASQVAQKTNGIRSSTVNKNVDHKIKKNFPFSSTGKLSRNLNKNLEMFNMGLIRRDQIEKFKLDLSKKSVSPRTELPSTNPRVVKSSSIKNPAIPIDMLLDLDTISSLKESSISTSEINSYVKPLLTSPIMVVSKDDINVVQEKLNSISDTEVISVSNSIPRVPSVSTPLIVTSSVSSSATVISSVGYPTYIVPSVSSPLTIMSSLSTPISVISSVPSHITVVSTKFSNKLSSEISNTNCILVSKNLPRLKEHSENIDTKIKPVIQTQTKHLKYSEINGDLTVNALDSEKHKPHTLYSAIKTSGKLFAKSLNSQRTEKISVMKHAHTNGICLCGPKYSVTNESMPQIFKSILKKKTSSLESSTKNLQLDRRKKTQKFDNILSTDIPRSHNLQVTLPNIIVPLNPSSLNQANTHDQVNNDSRLSFSTDSFIKCQSLNNMKSFSVETMSSTNNMTNKDSFQETKSSSNVGDYKGVKRKRSTS